MIEERKKITYTASATNRLEALRGDLNQKFEQYFKEMKNVPGDDIIEVTASDVDELASRIKIIHPSKYKTPLRQLLVQVYGSIGILMIFSGFFYDQLKNIASANSERLVLLLSGFVLTFIALFISYYFKSRERGEQHLLDYEKAATLKNDYISLLNNLSLEKHPISFVLYSASYGIGDKIVDVTNRIKELTGKNIFEGSVSPSFLGVPDPAYGDVKNLTIHCRVNGKEQVFVWTDGQRFKIT